MMNNNYSSYKLGYYINFYYLNYLIIKYNIICELKIQFCKYNLFKNIFIIHFFNQIILSILNILNINLDNA